MFGSGNSPDEKLKSIEIDTTKEIRYVSMAMLDSTYLGLRFYDAYLNVIVNKCWYERCKWTEI